MEVARLGVKEELELAKKVSSGQLCTERAEPRTFCASRSAGIFECRARVDAGSSVIDPLLVREFRSGHLGDNPLGFTVDQSHNATESYGAVRPSYPCEAIDTICGEKGL